MRLARYAPVTLWLESPNANRCRGKLRCGPMYGRSVGGARVRRVPSVLGKNPRDVRIHRGQLVHQLTRALDGDLLPKTIGRRLMIRSRHQQLLAVDPADDMRRIGGVADDGLPRAELLADLRGNAPGEREVRRTKPEMPLERGE